MKLREKSIKVTNIVSAVTQFCHIICQQRFYFSSKKHPHLLEIKWYINFKLLRF